MAVARPASSNLAPSFALIQQGLQQRSELELKRGEVKSALANKITDVASGFIAGKLRATIEDRNRKVINKKLINKLKKNLDLKDNNPIITTLASLEDSTIEEDEFINIIEQGMEFQRTRAEEERQRGVTQTGLQDVPEGRRGLVEAAGQAGFKAELDARLAETQPVDEEERIRKKASIDRGSLTPGEEEQFKKFIAVSGAGRSKDKTKIDSANKLLTGARKEKAALLKELAPGGAITPTKTTGGFFGIGSKDEATPQGKAARAKLNQLNTQINDALKTISEVSGIPVQELKEDEEAALFNLQFEVDPDDFVVTKEGQ